MAFPRLAFPTRRSPSLVASRRRRLSKGQSEASLRQRQAALAAEALESRALLAVTATLVGGDLVIAYNQAGDVLADITSDGTEYTVSGTGFAATTFKISDVTGVISVEDKAAIIGQQFKVDAGTSLANALQVNPNVESTSLIGGITTAVAGDVLIGSAAISLANDISTALTNDDIVFTGAVQLSGAASLSTGVGAGDITFSKALDGNQTLSLTAGTGNVTFSGLVGDTTPVGAITINSAADVTANGIRAASLTQVAGSGTTTLNGGAFTSAPAGTEAVRTSGATGVSLTGTNLAVNALIATANGGTVTFAESGTITIAADGDITSDGAVSLTGDGGITTAGDVTTTNDSVTFASATTLSGAASLSTGAGAGDITFSKALDGNQTLSLTAGTGNVTFSGLVGDTTPVGAITINSATNVTANGIRAASLTQVAGSGTTTLNGGAFTSAPAGTEAVRTSGATGVSLTGTNLAVNALIATTNGGTVTFAESGTITIAADGDITSDGAVSLTGDGGITTAGDVTTTNDSVTFASATTLSGPAVIDTGVGAGDITFSKALDGNQTLSLTAGTGNVTFSGLVGDTTPVGAITINSAADVTANGIRAASLTQVAGSGTTTLNGGAFTSAPAGTEAVRTSGATGVSLTGTNLAVNALIATTNGGTVTFAESGTITIAADGDITSDGAVSLTGDGGITTAGDVTTTNDSVTFASATTLSGPAVIDTGVGAGDITFSKALDGNQTLSLTAGTGNIEFKGAVGSGTPLGGIAILSAASTTADSTIKLDGSSKLAADGLTISENVNNVSFTKTESEIKNFTGNGVFFKGGSTNSLLSGFTVSGNGGNGMSFADGSYAGTTVTANTISHNGDKTAGVGNGILVQGKNLMIGWDADPAANTARNVIKRNAENGIEIRGAAATGNSILSNSIFLNGIDATGTMRTKVENGATVAVGKGIALTEQGNDSQVAPIIHDVVWDKKEGAEVVRVQLVVPAAGSYFVQVFSNTAADEQGIFPVDVNGFEGRAFVGPARAGSTPVAGSKPTIAGAGVVTGNTFAILEIPTSQLAAGEWLTATATALNGTAPTNTSEFSAGVQLLDAPALAVGGDGPSATWSTEYAFTAGSPSSKTIQLTTNGAGQPLTRGQLRGLSRLKNGTKIVVTPTGGGVNEVLTVAKASLKRSVLTVTLTESIGTTAGTFVLGGTSLPAAMLLNTSLDGVAAQNPLLNVGDAEMSAALIGAGVSEAEADAFVNRFQGGLRVASGDFNGDGYADLVTVAGGLPAAMAPTFGNAPLVLSIYNADPTTRGTWADASVNLANIPGFVSAGFNEGFLVTVGNVWEETSGSGSVVQELIVASSTKIAVIEVTSPRGGKPSIDATNATVIDLSTIAPGARTTGLAAGNFRPANDSTKLDDILVATVNATQPNSAQVHLFGSGDGTPNTPTQRGSFSIAVDGTVIQTGPRGQTANAFANGASLAVGDLDNAPDQRPELLLAAGAGGLGNFRVLDNAVVSGLNQAVINDQLDPNGRFAAPPRSTSPKWQPMGGPDFFIGGSPTAPMASGANAGMFAALVESSGRSSGSGGSGFKAEVFAALAGPNQTLNSIRQFWFDETQQPDNRWRSAHGSGSWLDANQYDYSSTGVVKKLARGRGLRLG